MDFYANNDLPYFNYVLFHYRQRKIVWPNEKEDIFVLISGDLLYGSLRFWLSVLSDVAFSIQTYKMQLWRIFWPSKFAGRLVWDHLLTETGLLALQVFHGILTYAEVVKTAPWVNFYFPSKILISRKCPLDTEKVHQFGISGEISLLWTFISLRTEMLHKCTLLPKSRKIANICSDPLFSVCTLDRNDASAEWHSEFFAVDYCFIYG